MAADLKEMIDNLFRFYKFDNQIIISSPSISMIVTENCIH